MATSSSSLRYLPFAFPSSITKTLFSISLLIGVLCLHFVPCWAKNSPPNITLKIALTAKDDATLTVPENIQVRSMLGLLQVEDQDSGPAGNVTCQTESPYISLPQMRPKLYTVQLENTLDREMIDSLDIVFLCTDQGSPALSTKAMFTLKIDDVNDNDPKFTQEVYKFAVGENGKLPHPPLGSVRAVDLDLNENGMVSYELEDENGTMPEHFHIDKDTGMITCTTIFDREKVDEIVLYAYSLDHGDPFLHDQAEVRIIIIDVNDNEPVILSKNFSIDEALAPMSLVGTLQASDKDQGRNGEVEFQLVIDQDGMYIPPFIVKANGDILAAVPFDRELKDQYTITVSATDLGDPPLSTMADVTITVLDVNDNRPDIISPKEFDDFDFDLSVNGSNYIAIDWYSPEDNRVVYQVSATDRDIRENGRIFYSIESINYQLTDDDSLFTIDKATGHVYFRRSVRNDDDPVQLLTFLVYDGGNPSLNATASLNVTLDVDFQALTFPPPTEPTTTEESVPGGSVVLEFTHYLYGLGLILMCLNVFN